MAAEASQYEPVEDVVYIPLEQLRVDPCNIRGGKWDGDTELIQSVERSGIHQPLVVRRLGTDDDGETVWGIVAGSRRYNAAIEAGLDKAPCRMMELDETQAMLYSMEENRNRRPTAKWRDVEYVGEVARQMLDSGMTKHEAFTEIGDTIGMSKPTITRYYRLCQLPGKAKALLREPEDLTQSQRDYLRGIPEYAPDQLPLDLGTLATVHDHFGDWEEARQVTAAFKLDGYASDARDNLAQRWAEHPDASLEELVTDAVERRYETRTIRFDTEVLEGLARAAVDRQMPAVELVQQVVASWLRDDDYL